MITVRDRSGLHPSMLIYLHRFEKVCQDRHLDVLIHCTLRTIVEQAKLFRMGRPLWEIRARAEDLREEYDRPDLADVLMGVGPQTGRYKVTNAAPGQSAHNYGLALDGGPLWQGKIIYDDPARNWVPDDIEAKLWETYGECIEEAGLQWAGRWKHNREMPHAQHPDFDWHERIKTEVFIR